MLMNVLTLQIPFTNKWLRDLAPAAGWWPGLSVPHGALETIQKLQTKSQLLFCLPPPLYLSDWRLRPVTSVPVLKCSHYRNKFTWLLECSLWQSLPSHTIIQQLHVCLNSVYLFSSFNFFSFLPQCDFCPASRRRHSLLVPLTKWKCN